MPHPETGDLRGGLPAAMQEALALAALGEGCTRPNPPVGAVVVKQGRVVGRGYHARAGLPHAEVVAMRDAGARARGADLYVTLEPCSTHGRTPPCTEAILAAGIRRVYAAMTDPNPRHRGRGLIWLRRRGLAVSTGLCRPEAAALLEPFIHWVATGRPLLTLKLAVSADGRIADARGASRWISGPASRLRVQALRRRCDAVLVGAGTVLADDPSLRPRPARGRDPWRLIADSRGRIPSTSRVLTDAWAARTVVFVTERCPARRRRCLAAHGARVVVSPMRDGKVDPTAILAWAGEQDLLHVLCEGGGQLAESLVQADLVDAWILVIAPKLLGGGGRPALAGAGWPIGAAPALRFTRVEPCGRDVYLEARPRRTARKRKP